MQNETTEKPKTIANEAAVAQTNEEFQQISKELQVPKKEAGKHKKDQKRASMSNKRRSSIQNETALQQIEMSKTLLAKGNQPPEQVKLRQLEGSKTLGTAAQKK